MYGTKETKEALDFVFAGVGAFKNAMSDGKLDLNDVGFLMPLVLAAGPAFTDITKIPKELGDLSAAEGKELMEHVRKKLDGVIDDAALKLKIEKGLAVALSVGELIAVL